MAVAIGIIVFLLLIAALSAPRGSGKIRLKRVRQIERGMSKKEIIKLVGKPYHITASGGGIEHWMWFQMDRNFGHTSFTVGFENGIATAVPEIPEDMR